jgi:hypothetical protein
MNDGAARFAARYPVVWHVIEAEGAGPWLATTGLLPAASLLHLAGIAADGENRNDFRPIAFGNGHVAILRQQIMPDRWLIPTLAGIYAGQPTAWRSLINAHVFLWTEERRRDAFVRACMRLRTHSRTVPPQILAFRTATLLEQSRCNAFFTRINSGSTVRGGARARRDESTFTRVEQYRQGAVAELAIRGRVTLDAAAGFEPISRAASVASIAGQSGEASKIRAPP